MPGNTMSAKEAASQFNSVSGYTGSDAGYNSSNYGGNNPYYEPVERYKSLIDAINAANNRGLGVTLPNAGALSGMGGGYYVKDGKLYASGEGATANNLNFANVPPPKVNASNVAGLTGLGKTAAPITAPQIAPMVAPPIASNISAPSIAPPVYTAPTFDLSGIINQSSVAAPTANAADTVFTPTNAYKNRVLNAQNQITQQAQQDFQNQLTAWKYANDLAQQQYIAQLPYTQQTADQKAADALAQSIAALEAQTKTSTSSTLTPYQKQQLDLQKQRLDLDRSKATKSGGSSGGLTAADRAQLTATAVGIATKYKTKKYAMAELERNAELWGGQGVDLNKVIAAINSKYGGVKTGSSAINDALANIK